MPTVHEVSAPLARLCVPVPPIQPGVCRICHAWPRPGFATCLSCSRVTGQLRHPCTTVVPVSLSIVPGPLHTCLRAYKDGDSSLVRRRASVKVVALLARFLHDHRDCLECRAASRWDVVTVVPSSTGRPGRHPLEDAIGLVPWLARQRRLLLAAGPARPSHNRATDAGFSVHPAARGTRVLLVDDTYTTGARAQSAASALARAGARVVAIVPVGRVVDPGYAAHVADSWRWWSAQPFRFDTCCVHEGAGEPRNIEVSKRSYSKSGPPPL